MTVADIEQIIENTLIKHGYDPDKFDAVINESSDDIHDLIKQEVRNGTNKTRSN